MVDNYFIIMIDLYEYVPNSSHRHVNIYEQHVKVQHMVYYDEYDVDDLIYMVKYKVQQLEGESSNRYHDFVPAKELFRRLRRSICTNDHDDHIQDT